MSLRLIPSLETSPLLVARCQRTEGRWLLLAVFTALLTLTGSQWIPIAAFLTVTTAFPCWRRGVVSAFGILIAVARPNWLDLPFLERVANQEGLTHLPLFLVRAVVVAVFVLLAGLAALAFRFPGRVVARRPVLAATVSFAALAAVVSIAPLTGWSRVAAWIGVLAISHMLWFFCYTLTDRNSGDPVSLQAGLWRPAWMAGTGSGTPIAKGAAYLRKIEAKTAEELAVIQIKGLKLLLWALLLKAGQVCFHYFTYTRLGIPEFEAALGRSAAGHPFAWYWNCLSVVAAFLASLLQMSVWGHQIVACARMAGFRALRNTYRPFASRTVAEFWNRFYFYFKELLVDMFFYPTYLRYFKRYPRLRMAAATMMAACAGNAIFHFFRDISSVAELGWWRAIAGFQTYLFYSFVLGAGICVSQLRAKRRNDGSHSWWRRRAAPVLCVSGFYCLLHIFDDTNRTYGLREHFVFAGRLFGF
jgi:D-alanyl-lipoteichoic acid acyltransferase DltB (MBOAT superfamily)